MPSCRATLRECMTFVPVQTLDEALRTHREVALLTSCAPDRLLHLRSRLRPRLTRHRGPQPPRRRHREIADCSPDVGAAVDLRSDTDTADRLAAARLRHRRDPDRQPPRRRSRNDPAARPRSMTGSNRSRRGRRTGCGRVTRASWLGIFRRSRSPPRTGGRSGNRARQLHLGLDLRRLSRLDAGRRPVLEQIRAAYSAGGSRAPIADAWRLRRCSATSSICRSSRGDTARDPQDVRRSLDLPADVPPRPAVIRRIRPRQHRSRPNRVDARLPRRDHR